MSKQKGRPKGEHVSRKEIEKIKQAVLELVSEINAEILKDEKLMIEKYRVSPGYSVVNGFQKNKFYPSTIIQSFELPVNWYTQLTSSREKFHAKNPNYYKLIEALGLNEENE